MYSCWKLDNDCRQELLKIFVPKYPDIIAHHITCKFGSNIMPPKAIIYIIGYCDDKNGLECFVVNVNGKSKKENDSFYHITWSINRSMGYKPVDSNEILKSNEFVDFKPMLIKATPMVI